MLCLSRIFSLVYLETKTRNRDENKKLNFMYSFTNQNTMPSLLNKVTIIILQTAGTALWKRFGGFCNIIFQTAMNIKFYYKFLPKNIWNIIDMMENRRSFS